MFPVPALAPRAVEIRGACFPKAKYNSGKQGSHDEPAVWSVVGS